MPILDTGRLIVRPLKLSDAAFILTLLNDALFLRNIGDRGVKNMKDARHYLRYGPIASYRRFGYGLCLVVEKETAAPAGICGLIHRDSLSEVDVGYALLPSFHGRGYATEAARAVMADGRNRLGLQRIVAFCSPDNAASVHVLEKLGLRFERKARLADDAEELDLFS